MRRILSLLLALAILLSMAVTAAATEAATDPNETIPDASEETGMVMSEAGLDMIRGFEGFSKYPYWDVSQWTVGYGTSCPSDKLDEYKANGITEEAADELLRTRMASYEKAVKFFAEKHGRTFTQTQFDALVSFTYNLGSGWVHKNNNFTRVMSNPDAAAEEVIFWFGAHCNAGGSILPGLVRRRLAEANLFLNGVYGTGRPENYCYVRLDANGGSLDSRLNAYDINTENRVNIVPTLSGRTFKGWFTEKDGGTQVTVLDKSTHNSTLYARWADGTASDGDTTETPEQPDQNTSKKVNVVVTGNYVNLRKGPGTNYTTVGQANSGDKLTITETKENGSLLWGNSEKGWICLRYTNYDTAVNQPQEPEEPEAPTEPEATEPTPTEPEATEPTPTEPEAPQPSKVMGTVKVNDALTIRKGPGTGYASVGYLHNNDRVEILAQKQVGSMTWGQIEKGWISLKYVNLDQTTEQAPEQTPSKPNAVTGTVKVSDCLLIRKGPGTSYGVVGTLKNGTTVTITDQKQTGSMTWGNMGKGWISMNYVVLQTSAEPAPETPEETTPAPETPMEPTPEQKPDEETTPSAPETLTGTVNVSDYLRIRSGPGTSYSVSGYYNKGDKVTILEKKEDGSITWGKTDRGWISLSYVNLDNDSNDTSTSDIRTVTADCLNVRSEAGTGNRVVGYLYHGEKVTILETKQVGNTTWGKIANGWISLDYAK